MSAGKPARFFARTLCGLNVPVAISNTPIRKPVRRRDCFPMRGAIKFGVKMNCLRSTWCSFFLRHSMYQTYNNFSVFRRVIPEDYRHKKARRACAVRAFRTSSDDSGNHRWRILVELAGVEPASEIPTSSVLHA